MSQVTADATMSGEPPEPSHPAITRDNVWLPEGSTSAMSGLLLIIGAVGLLVTVIGSFTVGVKHALASYQVGVAAAMALSLGSLFMVMVLHLTQAGWSATLRRQLENAMSLIWLPILLLVPFVAIELINGGVLLKWLDSSKTAGDPLAAHKAPFLNPAFFVLRVCFYAGAWLYLSRRLWRYSVDQDATGDKFLSNKARFTSSWGMLVYALTSTFFAFDCLMALDYHFFSTMWGVYYFAGSAFGAIALCTVNLALLRRKGKLEGVITPEHFHDLGKLFFAFTVFWAYIGYGQYFLIWYSNIPEETAYFTARNSNGWMGFTIFLVLGHFIAPFLIMIWRKPKRTPDFLIAMGAWMMLMVVCDMFWIIRPMVYAGEGDPGPIGPFLHVLLDVAGPVGVLGIFFGLLARKVASGPLVPLRDPKQPEALHHRNYV